MQIIADAMRDLKTVSLLDEETRFTVLAAFEQAMHCSFSKSSPLIICHLPTRLSFAEPRSLAVCRGSQCHRSGCCFEHMP